MAKKQQNECPVPQGVLLIVGGKENKGQEGSDGKETPSTFEKLEILKKFIELSGKKDPVIEVITSAATEGEAAFGEYEKAFAELEIGKVGHIHHLQRHEVQDDTLLERIDNADGFFFAGGDQLKYSSLYGGSELLRRLKGRYIREKIVIGGTSAGAMALSTPMIYAGNDEVQELGGEIKITTGLEFLKDVCIDTHFVNRGRFIRMAQVIVTNPSCIGMGIAEDTAVIVRNGLEAEIVGSGLVVVIDGREITEANIAEFLEKKPLTIRDLKVHILSRGNQYIIPQVNPQHR